MTEERTLQKVRSDIIKLQTAKSAAFASGVMARCWCVVNGPVTTAMENAGKPHHIHVVSISQFTKLFFDFESYRVARQSTTFGSSVNPITGQPDPTDYVPVRYNVNGRRTDVTSRDIAEMLRDGKKVIMLGEYGSGKSRCVRDVFKQLAENAAESFCYPLAIDLRKSWGLRHDGELIRRHFLDLGLDQLEASAVRAFRAGAFAVLLDGFDEIGSQAWSNDAVRLRTIRAKSLEGVKDIISTNPGGVLITGREHYFSNADEMYSALGLTPAATVIIHSKSEFSDSELLAYFTLKNIEVDIPAWLPRRPLICQTISDLAADQMESMFGENGNEAEFWNYFIQVLCKRDASIHVSFDAETIYRIFVNLARLTRSKSANVGPISPAELQGAFEAATGSAPVEEASIMLQRLPSLGRVGIDSNDRQFVDVYILDGLRAKDIAITCAAGDPDFTSVAASKWTNPLDDLGQRILSADSSISEKTKLASASRAQALGNYVLASDLVGSLMRESGTTMDFQGLELHDAEFIVLALDERKISNLKLRKSWFGELVLPIKGASGCEFSDCLSPKVSGISSSTALPDWIKELRADSYDSVASISRIRRIGLSPAHEILTTIVRKTFFQKGAGRKEEALLRGLGRVGAKGISSKILNLMIGEGLLTSFRGVEGTVYAPVRAHTKRMQRMLDELDTSDDPLWTKVASL